MATASNSTSSAYVPRINPDIPLITCPDCGRFKVTERVVQTDENGNKGRVFYRCPGGKRGRGCQYYRWEEHYLAELQDQDQKEKAMKEIHAQEDNKITEAPGTSILDLKINTLIDIGKEVVLLLKCIGFVCVCGLIWNVFAGERK